MATKKVVIQQNQTTFHNLFTTEKEKIFYVDYFLENNV